ncbi:MAG: glycosyltransferase [Anaeromyxobacter sp.]
MPRAAVLLPVRDAARTLRAAAVSMLRQTWRDLALVCVDDGSTDATPAVLDRLAARDRRVRVVRAPANEGIARALTRGLAACDADVVVRMDADDLAHPARVATLLAALDADPSLAAAGSRVRLFPRRAVKPGMARYAAWLNGLVTPALVARDLLVEAPLVHPAAAIRRADLERVGGWRAGDFPEDYDLWLRLAAAGRRLTNVPDTLLAWRESGARLTRTDPRYRLDRHVALKCAHLAAGWLAGRTEVALWGAGETGRAFADALLPHGIRPALFVDVDPRKIGRTKRGAPVVGVDALARVRGLPLLVAVGAPGARDLIRAELARAGFQEGAGYVVVS